MQSNSSLNDFLIDFGLNMVSNAPTGNIFQTAATQAKDPFKNFQASKAAYNKEINDRSINPLIRIAETLEEILRLVKLDQERSKKYMEEQKDE